MATTKQIYDACLQYPFFDHLSPYFGLGCCVFMANYYNSVRLARDLYRQETSVCRTISSNGSDKRIERATKIT